MTWILRVNFVALAFAKKQVYKFVALAFAKKLYFKARRMCTLRVSQVYIEERLIIE